MRVTSFLYSIPDKLPQIYTGKKTKEDSTSQKVTSLTSRFGKYLSWGFLYSAPLSILGTIAVSQAKNYSEATVPLKTMFNSFCRVLYSDSTSEPYSENFMLFSLFMIVGLDAPISEEIIFRGVIQNGTKRISKYAFSKISDWKEKGKDERYSSAISRITSAFFFATSHLSNAPFTGGGVAVFQTINTGILSYWITKAYEEDGLMGAVGVHMGNNLHTLVPSVLGLFLGKIAFQK